MPETLKICPWTDPVLDAVGHDPRSRYVETFWLPTLGPTALLLLRHLATQFENHPQGIDLPVADTSRSLGLGDRNGNQSPIVRSLARLEVFDLACNDGANTIAVRRNLPRLNARQLRRLPASLRSAHAQWSATQLAAAPPPESATSKI